MNNCPKRDQLICALYQQGLLLKDIAERVGLKPHSVGSALKRLGFERPTKPRNRIPGGANAGLCVVKKPRVNA